MQRYWIVIVLLLVVSGSKAADTLVIESEHLPTHDTVLVFQPSMMDDLQRYPVLYLLHGYGGNYEQWNRIADLQHYADRYSFLIVCPDGLKSSWYFDSPRQPEMQFESFMLSDLMPQVQERYPVDTVLTFVSGLSMGGHGAMYLFLRNPGRFYSAGSTSGVLSLHASGLKFTSLSHRLGDYSSHQAVFDKYSALNYLDTLAFSDREILFDCGSRDHLYDANVEFYEACKEKRIQAHFISSPGRHNHAYWTKSIDWHFVFFARLVHEQRTTKEE